MELTIVEQNRRIKLVKSLNKEVASILGQSPKFINIDVNLETHSFHGDFNYRENRIRISKYLIKEEDIKEVILHELCHAYCPPNVHHGRQWQITAKIIGDKFNTKITVSSTKNVLIMSNIKSLERILLLLN